MNNNKTVSLEEVIPVILSALEGGNSVTFSPKGSSMLPMLKEGRDSVTLERVGENLKKYDIPLYRRGDGQYVLHRIVKAGESYTCIGDNQFCFERGVERSQIIAVVTEFTRKGRKYKVCAPSYRFYCRFWHYTRPFRRAVSALKCRMKRLFGR